MKTTFILIILSIFSIGAFSQLYKNNRFITIKGQVYKVEVKMLKGNADTITEKKLEVSFYPVYGENDNRKDVSGNVGPIKKVFLFNQKYKNKKTVNLLPALSSGGKGPLMNYNRCYVKMRNGEVSLSINSAVASDRVQVTLPESLSYLATYDETHAGHAKKSMMPAAPIAQGNSVATDSTGSQGAAVSAIQSSETYSLCLVGDIDSQKFPRNPRLLGFLKNNSDFVFKLSMDLYLDILRFSADSADYDREKIVNFLTVYDLMYMRYGFNEMSLNKKVDACTKLLRKVNLVYAKGDIFYKDYKLELTKSDVTMNPFVLPNNEPQKDDYYNGKKVKGEPDRFYAENGLNIYLANWSALSSPAVRSADETYMSCLSEGSQAMTLRIYFMVQPFSAYSKKGVFKGVTANGLKGILFADCPGNYVCSIDTIEPDDKKVKDSAKIHMYKAAVSYLQKFISRNGINGDINPKTIYGNGYYPLGDWKQIYPDCEVGYTFWSGSVTRLPGRQALVSFKMLTNYQCPLQPGYDLTFWNRNTNARFSVPVASASLMKNENSGDYYMVSAKLGQDILRKMLDANVNSVACQCLGSEAPSPKFLSRNNVINHGTEKLSALIDVEESGTCEKLSSLLKTGF